MRPEDLANGLVYPPLSTIRTVSQNIAAGVAQSMHESGRASLPRPADILKHCESLMYDPSYNN